jgi:hypothetical protein
MSCFPRPHVLQQLSVAGYQLGSRVGVHYRVINKLCVTNSTYSLNLEEVYVQGKRIMCQRVRTQRAVLYSVGNLCLLAAVLREQYHLCLLA